MRNRLVDLPDSSFETMLQALVLEEDGSFAPGAVAVLLGCRDMLGSAINTLLVTLDIKHFYGTRLWELFTYCQEDYARFIYHVCIELPEQISGHWLVPDDPRYQTAEFVALRQFGRAGSYWALQNPPDDGGYQFPLLNLK
jgi:uncharacterized membrane protein